MGKKLINKERKGNANQHTEQGEGVRLKTKAANSLQAKKSNEATNPACLRHSPVQLLKLKSVSKSMAVAVWPLEAVRRIAWRCPSVANQRLAGLGLLQSGGCRVGLGNLATSWPLVCIVRPVAEERQWWDRVGSNAERCVIESPSFHTILPMHYRSRETVCRRVVEPSPLLPL